MKARSAGSAAGLAVLAAATLLLARKAPSPSEAQVPPAGVVDSAIPREEALRRFRVGLLPTDSLEGGEGSLEALVISFVKALETRDTAAFGRLALSQREFAYVYYETNPQSLPPYDLSPSLYWFMLEGGSRGGLSKTLQNLGGIPLHYSRTRCEGEPSREGQNTVYGPCVVVRQAGHPDSLVQRLFGPIIERRGRWKFVSYANKLD
ncbi:MAG TPA: hypothetical protein VFB61_16815 [Gemmatimonadales bacterium]|nr:hypothetical protein [Gemmatimonadales bacterium]